MSGVNFECICEVLDLFKENGSFMSINERLFCDKNTERNFSVEGLYMFYQQDNTVLVGASSILYVGRSGSLSKRFKEHKSQWLKRYLARYPKLSLWYGCIPVASTHTLSLWGEGRRVHDIENVLWRSQDVLGLKRLNTILEMIQQ
jgi:hypothetical protein